MCAIALLIPLPAITIAQIVIPPTNYNCGYCGDVLGCTATASVTAELNYQTGILTISGTGRMKIYASPATAPWNLDRDRIREVVVVSGVTDISKNALARCQNLTRVELPNGLTAIGEDAFLGCTALSSITIPGSVSNVGSKAFESCSHLRSVTLSDGAAALHFPSESYSPFYGCNNIENLYVGRNVDNPILSNAILKQLTISSGVTMLGASAFKGCSVKKMVLSSAGSTLTLGTTTISIPPFSVSYSDSAYSPFYRCVVDTLSLDRDVYFAAAPFTTSALKTITIGNNINVLSDYIFYNCKMPAADIPSSITKIGNKAFDGCKNLSQINVSGANTRYSSNDGILYNKAGDTLLLCPLYKVGAVELPQGLKCITDAAFWAHNSISSVSIPSSVNSIGSGAFSQCEALTMINVSADNAQYSSANGVLFNKSISRLIQYPSGKPDLGYTIPSSVTAIEDYAFAKAASLTALYNLNTQPQPLNATTFSGTNIGGIDLYASNDIAKTRYANENIWKDFKRILAMTMAASITLSPSEHLLFVGDTLQITYTILPADASNKQLRWTSDMESWATVSSSGMVRALGAGIATITATTMDGSNRSARSVIRIINPSGNNNGATDVAAQETMPLRVYPNPAKNQITVQIPQDTDTTHVIIIYSINGAVLGRYHTNNFETTIDISHLSNGLYVVRAGNKMDKFVKK
jgi:hypothetical protein